RNPDGKENPRKTALFHPRDVNASVGMARSQVEFRIKHSLRRIIVCVYDHGRKMQLLRFLRNGIGCQAHHQQTSACKSESDSSHIPMHRILSRSCFVLPPQFVAYSFGLSDHARQITERIAGGGPGVKRAKAAANRRTACPQVPPEKNSKESLP